MSEKLFLACCFLFTCLLVWWSCDHILFWDTVQFVGKHGGWYYEQGVFAGLLPMEMDSGHPPFFGMYQAILWKVFGKSLTTAHFSMLPFLLMNVYYVTKLGWHYLGDNYYWFVLGFILCPFYLGHSILVSPDIILVTGFVICLYGIIAYKRAAVVIGSIILAMISMRGFAVMGGLLVYQLWLLVKRREESTKIAVQKVSKCFGWGVGLFLLFQLRHYQHSSWVGFHEASPWSPSFGIVGIKGLMKNALVFSWRLADYGMVFAYLVIGVKLLKKKNWAEPLIPLSIILIIILGLLTIPFEGLLNHRYYLPIQILVLLLALKYLSSYKKVFSGLLVFVIACGNFLVYPISLSQGWDSTAAHWPYYKMEKEMYGFIQDAEEINLSEVGTAFPLRVTRKHLDLTNETSGYHPYDLSKDKYILHSNIMNEFTDKETAELRYWKPVKALSSRGVNMTLYKKN